jgi:hypothetical protein
MVTLNIEGSTLILEVQGWDKLWAMKSRLEISLAHIKGVHIDPDLKIGWYGGLKMPGTEIPSVFRAGTFYVQNDWVFWDVRHPEQAIIIDLADERYAKLIVEVQDPQIAVQQLQDALAHHQDNVAAAHAELDAAL